MCETFIKQTLKKVQENSSCHKKYLLLLEKKFYETPTDEFLDDFVSCLRKLFIIGSEEYDEYVERILNFCGAFVKLINDKEERNATTNGEESTNEFLSKIIHETLKFHNTRQEWYRFNAYRFVTILLEHIGNATLSNEICDTIQEKMLIGIDDSKTSVRLKAITALVRLQEPRNPDCPIIEAYTYMLADSNPQIRRAVIKEIAPNLSTLSRIRDTTRDSDHNVRKMAFTRCADLGAKIFRVSDRHAILLNGFTESNVPLHQHFKKYLIPKWFSGSNIVEILASFKLDADEHDIKSTFELSKRILHVLFKTHPITDIIDDLPIEENKLVPPAQLSYEVTTFWCILVEYLRGDNSLDDYLDRVLPELTPFCHYIDEVVKIYSSKTMEEWEYLDYQSILLNLFHILEHFHMDDEVGRQATHKLIIRLLQQHKFVFKLVNKMISILSKIITDPNLLTNEICEVISEIREPMISVVEQAPKNPLNLVDLKVGHLEMKLACLDMDKETAVEKEDYRRAAQIQNEGTKIRAEIQELKDKNAPTVIQKRTIDNSKETICRCLDVINSVLELRCVKQMSPSLRACLDEFIIKLLQNEETDIHWRLLKSIGLYCIINREFANEYAKILALPIASYRLVPYTNKMAVIISLAGVSDVLRIYGVNMFCPNNSETSSNSTRRQLYHNDETDDGSSEHFHNNMSLDSIMNIILDMIDDEDEDIRNAAVMALIKLCLNKFTINPTLISRIILKWYNPSVDVKLQQRLGLLIEQYTRNNKNTSETIEKAVLPTLVTLLGAPKTSPLSDVDVDNVMKFLSHLTEVNTQITHLHRNIAMQILQEVCKKPKDPIMCSLAKMLSYLKVDKNDEQSMQEFVRLLEIAMDEVDDLKAKKYLQKFADYLKSDQMVNVPDETNAQVQNSAMTSAMTETLQTENDVTAVTANERRNELVIRLSDVIKKKQGKVDKKREEPTVQRKSLRVSGNRQSTSANQVQETVSSGGSYENDNYTIETPSSPMSTPSIKRKFAMAKSTLSEDSSNSGGSSDSLRRSKRQLKKHKLRS